MGCRGRGGSLEGSGNLEKTGNAKLTINTANTNYTGKVILGGGTLEMGDDAALGAGSLSFDGGILQYGAGVTADISGQISSTSKNSIKVDTNGNAVTWASVDNYKAMAMEKIRRRHLESWRRRVCGRSDGGRRFRVHCLWKCSNEVFRGSYGECGEPRHFQRHRWNAFRKQRQHRHQRHERSGPD